MRILVIADEVWNDRIHGNNVLTNWFQGFPAEFAEIYASPGLPYNNICERYFQITDAEMVASIRTGKKAGRVIVGDFSEDRTVINYNSTDVGHLDLLRKHFGNSLRLLKTVVWNHGKINEEAFASFIKDFAPDLIFSARFAHSKILRLEKLALKYAQCPIVAFTGDNEYSLRRFSFNPIFWGNLLYQRRCLKRMMPSYSLYYTLSERQIQEYQKVFDVPMKVLRKCAPREIEEFVEKKTGNPIQIVYGGKLYAGRDKTLAEVAKAINILNKDSMKIQLHIYTGSQVEGRLSQILDDKKNSFIHRPVSSAQLEAIYHESDIALSVESFALAQRLATRVSFSTKLIDCLYSTCAVMMIGWKENTGFEYLKSQDAAICIDSVESIMPTLMKMVGEPEMIHRYRRQAYKCLTSNHGRKKTQNGLLQDFYEVIEKNKALNEQVDVENR